MSRIQCFMLEPTDQVSVKLRRYAHQENGGECPLYPGKYSYHTTSVFLRDEPAERDERGYISNGLGPVLPHDDPRWPKTCGCGYVFRDDDEWQHFTELIYRRVDTGEEVTLRDAPAGAMWYAPWLDQFHVPQDAHNLMVKTPGGDWAIDGPANNCSMKEDVKQEKHHCWVRTGVPPDVTAGKDGPTCSAGAGSIQAGDYHGYLRNGFLED